MNVGAMRVRLRLPENGSLKGKRHVVKSICGKVESRFNVSIAEIDDLDQWRLATLGVVCVSNDGRFTNEILSRVVSFIETCRGDAEFLDYEMEILNAL